VRRSSQFDVVTDLPVREQILPRDAAASLYRVAQEAMNNIVRHAGATKVTLTLRRSPPSLVTLTVTDNGKGFDPDAARAGFGLRDMAARVRLFDGELSLRSSRGVGTTIEVRMKGGGDEAR
jgi:signal transduction histidine kinase